jgi:hypothetical protein
MANASAATDDDGSSSIDWQLTGTAIAAYCLRLLIFVVQGRFPRFKNHPYFCSNKYFFKFI